MDFIITVFDAAAGEACPSWPGHPATAHWNSQDPAAVKGRDDEKRAASGEICRQAAERIKSIVSLPLAKLEKNTVLQEIKKIGETAV
jgi:arsenate reductase